MQSKLCLLTVFVMLVAACREPDGREFMAPEIVSAEAVIDGATAVFRCTLSGGRAEGCGFILDDGNVKHELEGVLQDNVFTATASGLEVDKTYRWEAFVTAGSSVIRSQEQSFTAPDGFIPIPDAAFKAYLLEEYDSNQDGEISCFEAQYIWHISFCTNELNVKSLSGIEYMPNLEEINCSGDFIGDFDLDNYEHYYLSKIYHLGDKYGPIGTLESVDVSHNPELRVLNVSNNAALGDYQRVLDLSKILKLECLYLGFTALQMPDISHIPGITELFLGHLWGPFPDLKPLSQLRKLDISFEQTFKRLDVDVSHCPYLEELIVSYTAKTLSDLSYNPELRKLSLKCCDFSTIDLSSLANLRYFDGSEGHLLSVDVSANPELYFLDLSPMTDDLLETLYIAPGQVIPGVTENRSTEFIPERTRIVEKSVE